MQETGTLEGKGVYLALVSGFCEKCYCGTMNILECLFTFHLGSYLKVEFLGQYGNSIFTVFEETSTYFSFCAPASKA